MDKETCMCGEKFDDCTWKCIPIKREQYDEDTGWQKYGVPPYNYMYICPNCDTPKVK